MMKALFLKSASNPLVISLAEIEDEQLTILHEVNSEEFVGQKASESLFYAIDTLLTDMKLQYSDLERIYVASGPGSYTAARLLVTIVKTIAFMNPHIAIYDASILDIFLKMSKMVSNNEKVLAVAEARRNKYYVSAENAAVVSTDELLELMNGPIALNGQLFIDGCEEIEMIPNKLIYQVWKEVSHKVDDIMLYEPFYLEAVTIG